jgi:hypothetical protein
MRMAAVETLGVGAEPAVFLISAERGTAGVAFNKEVYGGAVR